MSIFGARMAFVKAGNAGLRLTSLAECLFYPPVSRGTVALLSTEDVSGGRGRGILGVNVSILSA